MALLKYIIPINKNANYYKSTFKIKKGKLEEDKRIKHFKTNHIKVESKETIRFNVDGEKLKVHNLK